MGQGVPAPGGHGRRGPAGLAPAAREVEQLPERLRRIGSEQRVQAVVDEINVRIVEYHRHPTQPYVTVQRVDPDQAIRLWRESGRDRPGAGTASGQSTKD